MSHSLCSKYSQGKKRSVAKSIKKTFYFHMIFFVMVAFIFEIDTVFVPVKVINPYPSVGISIFVAFQVHFM